MGTTRKTKNQVIRLSEARGEQEDLIRYLVGARRRGHASGHHRRRSRPHAVVAVDGGGLLCAGGKAAAAALERAEPRVPGNTRQGQLNTHQGRAGWVGPEESLACCAHVVSRTQTRS
eukprot:1185174-Prorocentrum_minimum.AAC.2